MPRPITGNAGGSSWMFELTKEVERLQQQIEGLGHNSQALQDLVMQAEGLSVLQLDEPHKEVRIPSTSTSRAIRSSLLNGEPRWSSEVGRSGQETWSTRTLRQSQAIEAEKRRMTSANTRASGYWTKIEDDYEGVDVDDVMKAREELLKVQFHRLDGEKKGYLGPLQFVDLAERFDEEITQEAAQLLCEAIATRSESDGVKIAKDDPQFGLRFAGFCYLMAPDDEHEEHELREVRAVLQAAKRAVQAEAKERLLAEQERKRLAHKQHMRGVFATVFDLVTVGVIISNALVMGLSTDIDPDSSAWDVAEVGFFCFYMLEYLIKLKAQGCRGYYSGAEAYWNWFDNACLIISFIDLLSSYIVRQTAEESGGSEAFMLVRMLRLARLARLVRLMRFRMFHELKLMVLGLFSGLRALAWAIVPLMFTIYTFGVLMKLVSQDLPEFSSMPSSMFTLFRCFVTDGCVSYDGTPLPEKLRNRLGLPFFLMYILTTMVIGVGFTNLIMAVFIDNVLKSQGQRKLKEIGDTSAAVCTDLKLQFRRFLCEDTTAASQRGLFSRLSNSARQKLSSLTSDDYYSDQATKKKIAEATYRILQEDKVSISREMFSLWLQDAEFTTMLEEADVDMSDKFRMFDILDVDMGGELSPDELVTGLMQWTAYLQCIFTKRCLIFVMLRGDVSKGDIVAIMLKVRHLTYAIEEIQHVLCKTCSIFSNAHSRKEAQCLN